MHVLKGGQYNKHTNDVLFLFFLFFFVHALINKEPSPIKIHNQIGKDSHTLM